ncbi:Rrf2 family transcriptional regulator [Paenibacillus kribbensis]|nr:Rrf2 family transcriptional regulator [Paenibacillus kribbensis]
MTQLAFKYFVVHNVFIHIAIKTKGEIILSIASRGVYIGPPRLKTAIHAMVWLAKSGSMVSSGLIASQVDSHATFIRRVMQSLNSAGIVESKGGREGGYFLKKPSTEITLGDIYEAINNDPNDVKGNEKVGEQLSVECDQPEKRLDGEQLDVELEQILQQAELNTIEYLRNYTIAELVDRVRFF